MLDSIMAANITERENEYNLDQAIKEGIPQEQFSVMYLNFDEIDQSDSLKKESFDVIYANDCFLHSTDK